MECFKSRIGKMDITLLVSDRLYKIIFQANRKVNFSKRIAKMRNIYHGEIYDDLIVFSPSFIFALEDELEQNGYLNLLHNTILKFPKKQQSIFYVLLREGKSFRYLTQKNNISFDEGLLAVQALFTQLSLIINKGEKYETIFSN